VSNKIKLKIEDIASYTTLPFTIYNGKGGIVCRKGDLINAKILSQLSLIDIFKLDTTVNPSAKENIISKISQDTTDFVISVTKELLEAAEKGKTPSIKACYAARDKIFHEVVQNINEIQHLGEVRIYYDDYNLSHGINVATLSTALGIKLGMDKTALQLITMGALLHDIGKTKLPKQLINKPGKLTAKEYELAKLHAPLGAKVIKNDYALDSSVYLIALEHHERYDGSGYTQSKQGDKINFLAQIVSLADVYDASASDKVYAEGKSPREIIKEILKINKYFNPKILYTLVHMVNYNTGSLKENIARNIK
jgi:putative nucleotidyltransferase with HDIG domain